MTVRRAFGNIGNFFVLLVHLPLKGPYVPKSHTGMARDAMHASRRGSGTTATDKFLATEISKGHQIKLHGDPGSSRPVVGYGGRPPKHEKRSGLVTFILIVLAVIALIALGVGINSPL
ncbi:hypothetical protein [Candidatus Poriferisodalis sp.]|uniref:hypothetical protein n=1 Tax=Candidatus Poriferisodalis sp. TaxID=3101277 RepID=UPI003B014F4C